MPRPKIKIKRMIPTRTFFVKQGKEVNFEVSFLHPEASEVFVGFQPFGSRVAKGFTYPVRGGYVSDTIPVGSNLLPGKYRLVAWPDIPPGTRSHFFRITPGLFKRRKPPKEKEK